MPSSSRACIPQETDAVFRRQVDDWVLAELKDQRLPFDDLLSRLHGVFPSEVLASIRRLAEKALVPKQYHTDIEMSIRNPVLPGKKTFSEFSGSEHIDHPLDFEWPFTNHANKAILRSLHDIVGGRAGVVLCLGCPTFFDYATTAGTSHRFILWDKNAAASGQMKEIQSLANLDLTMDVVPRVDAQCAVLDPPWYNSFYQLFIWASARNLQTGGKLLLSFPPIGTRPSAGEDLTTLLRWCNQMGVEFRACHQGYLPYRMPLFELNALRAQGIHNIPLDWRRGDLVILEKTHDTKMPRPRFPKDALLWHDYGIGVVRLKIRSGDTNKIASPLRCVAKTSILPSVSTRYPGRHLANVVTSGNRFLFTQSPLLLEMLCKEICASRQFPSKKGNRAVSHSPSYSRLRAQLLRLLRQEERETLAYLSATNQDYPDHTEH